jgi:hypothetical protein
VQTTQRDGDNMQEYRVTCERPLGDAETARAHVAQWDAAELCYGWLVEWDEVEVQDAEQMGRLRGHLEVMVRGLHAVLADLDGVHPPVRAV